MPMIMVGPGTGVAPFVGFLEHIENSTDLSVACERYLFFGCRNEDLDYIYRSKLEAFLTRKVLSHLVVSFSQQDGRSETRSRYVQDSVRKHAEGLAKLLLSNARTKIYVCGDIQRMSKDVCEAFTDILVSAGGKTREEAEIYLNDLKASKRYVQDLWI
ncbi:unnamed protein product [Soboliphyme baturini]|uniref:NAD_binding_1 domain-containing protein n=1 Tax=Soboliphyme baturini TaxID=241478 RepID=A0A183IRZ3_9BILA|nr:unnamed protein product [Soboliphyme baturini]